MDPAVWRCAYVARKLRGRYPAQSLPTCDWSAHCGTGCRTLCYSGSFIGMIAAPAELSQGCTCAAACATMSVLCCKPWSASRAQ